MAKNRIIAFVAACSLFLTGCASNGAFTADGIVQTLREKDYQGACRIDKSDSYGGEVGQVTCTSSVNFRFDIGMQVFESEEHLIRSFDDTACGNSRYRIGKNVIVTDGDDGELSPFFENVKLFELKEFVPKCM